MNEAKELLPLAIGIAIAFAVRVLNEYNGSVPETLGAEARRVFVPSLMAFGGFLAAGESYTHAAAQALLSAGVALGLTKGKLRPPTPPTAALMVALSLAPGCASLPMALGVAAQVGQYAAAAIDAAESAANRWFAAHPDMDAEAAIGTAVTRARVAIVAYDAAVAAGERPSTAALLDAYGALHAALDEYGILDGLPPLGGAQGAPTPGPAAVPTPGEFASAMHADAR